MTLRQVFRIHSWAGLAAAVVLLVVGASGACLVFGEEIDHALFPQLHEIPHEIPAGGGPVDVDAALNEVRAAYDGWSLVRVRRLPQTPTQTMVVELAKRDAARAHRLLVYVDPYDGTIQGARGAGPDATFREHPLGVLFELHTTLLAGRAGAALLSLVALLLLVAVVTGAVLHKKHLVRTLTFRWRRADVKHGYRWLHEVIGTWSLVLNALWSVTGFWLAAPALLRRPAPAPPPIDAPLSSAISLARAQDGFRPLGVRGAPDGTIRVYGASADQPRWLAASSSAVVVEPRTNRITRTEWPRQQSAVRLLELALYPLHVGAWGGIAARAAYVPLALSAPMLSITGTVLWRRRLGRRSGASAPQRNAAALVRAQSKGRNFET